MCVLCLFCHQSLSNIILTSSEHITMKLYVRGNHLKYNHKEAEGRGYSITIEKGQLIQRVEVVPSPS